MLATLNKDLLVVGALYSRYALFSARRSEKGEAEVVQRKIAWNGPPPSFSSRSATRSIAVTVQEI